MLLEVCKEGGVSQGLQPRGVIRHRVVLAVDEAHDWAVAVFPLVEAGRPAEVGGHSFRADRSFAVSRHGWSVVAERTQSAVAYVHRSGSQLVLEQQGGLLEVTVRDRPVGVVFAHEGGLYVRRERHSPDEGASILWEQHAAGARFCGIGGSHRGGFVGDEFR